MKYLDFSSMQKKYPLLNSKDVSFLNKFFNDEKTQLLLEEVENIRKSKIRNIIIYILVGIFLFLLTFLLTSGEDFSFKDFIIPLEVTITYLIIGLFIIGFFGKDKTNLKSSLVPEFVKSMNFDIEYSKSGSLFKDNISKLKNKSVGLLKYYTRVDFREDSIRYILGEDILDKDGLKQKSIEITGCEVKTSEKRTRRTKNGTSTYYVVTNHCYLMKIDFKNPKFILKKPIKLFEDVADNYVKKMFVVAGIQTSIIFGFLSLISGGENSDGYLPEFLDLVSNNIEISIAVIIGMYFIIWSIYSYIKSKNRVKLENIDFEKEFDVYSEDQIESRRLLTPSFMYRLVDFVNKISHKRIYEMYFHGSHFYLKYNLLATNSIVNGNFGSPNNYMEFSKWKNVFKNLEDYVEFYLEIKNITSLSKDLKLFYYDKGMMTKNLVNGNNMSVNPNTNQIINKKRFFFF